MCSTSLSSEKCNQNNGEILYHISQAGVVQKEIRNKCREMELLCTIGRDID